MATPAAPAPPRALIIEDDDELRAALCRALQRNGFAAVGHPGLEGLAAVIKAEPPDYAVIDLKLADGDGMEALALVRAHAPRAAALVLTGHGSIPAAVAAVRAGALDFATKPIGGAELADRLRALPPPPELELDEVERAHIQRVLDEVGGNVSEAARRMGLHRRTLQRKLLKLP
ncbi:MAG: response regulator [Deltaproteobacteria bacterium]|nr:response regulator [Deltaproteobacteria bacterium]